MRISTRLLVAVVLVAGGLLALPTNAPAALIWRRGEGWSWEREGVTTGKNPKEQLEIAKALKAKKAYGDAFTAYQRVVRKWPTSFAAQEARLGMAECLTAKNYFYKAFKEYQNLIEKHPGSEYFETALQRQFELGNLFLGGAKHKIWGIKILPGLDKAVEVFQQVVKNGPYSKVGPESQFRIGLAYEKQKEYISAVHAYEKLVERYPQDPLAEAAQFEMGMAYKKEAARAEYDQNTANQAIAAFSDFLVRYPKSDKVALATQYREGLKQEQAKGLYHIGQFYEKNNNKTAALIYYNEVIEQNPKCDWATAAQRKIVALNTHPAPAPVTSAPVPTPTTPASAPSKVTAPADPLTP